VTQHGEDNAWFGQGYGNPISPSNGSAGAPGLNAVPGTTLTAGSRSPVWNGYLFEARYVYSPQMILLARYEAERMQQQATPGTAQNLGNVNNYTVGYRYNPFMNPRAGMALHGEFNVYHQDLTGPTNPVTGATTDTNTSELLFGIDFDF